MKTLLVTTGNGMFGRALVNALAGSEDVVVRAMVRDLDSFDVVADNVVAVKGDMDDPASLAAAVEGVTDIFLVSPMDEHIATREMNVVDAAVATGSDIRVLKLHGAVEHRGDALSQLHQQSITHLKASGLPWTLICPNSVMETCLIPFAQSISYGEIPGSSGHGKVGMVALADVAQATSEVVAGGGFFGESVFLTGPAAVDLYEVAAAFTEVLGRDITYDNMTDDDFANMLISVGAFPDREAVDMQVLCHYQAWRRGDAAMVADGFQQVTGHGPMTVKEWIGNHQDLFAAHAG